VSCHNSNLEKEVSVDCHRLTDVPVELCHMSSYIYLDM